MLYFLGSQAGVVKTSITPSTSTTNVVCGLNFSRSEPDFCCVLPSINKVYYYYYKGYHQLELKEGWRNVTTFSAHISLCRYKKLNYGTRSAADTFQETIREELSSPPDLFGEFGKIIDA